MKSRSRRINVGIIGVGRLGQAVARRLAPNVNLLLADKVTARANKLASELTAKAKTVKEAFLKSDVLLLLLSPSDICPLVKKYSKTMKSNALLVNMATSLATEEVRKEIEREDIRVAGAKLIGQAYAILKGYQAIFILSTGDPCVVDLLEYLFSPIGKIIVGDEMLAGRINTEATRFGLRLAIDLRKQLEKICSSKEIIDIAIKTVAVGTIQDYPPNEPNHYIDERRKELLKEK